MTIKNCDHLMNELKYSIYLTGAVWTQNNITYYNRTDFCKMYKEDPGIAVIRQKAIEWWENLITHKEYKDKDCQLVRLNCFFVEKESWCLNWFNHYTYNTHLSDNDLLLSFESFIERKRRNDKKYVLMGADELWRWRGPCHCDKCRKRGITFIDH